MVKLPKTLKNPLLGAAALCLVILYFSPVSPRLTQSLLSSRTIYALFSENIKTLEGVICSNPVASKKYGGTYQSEIRVSSLTTKDGARSSASGYGKIYIPKAFVEAYFPGKLYTKSRGENALLADTGAVVRLEVQTCKDGSFLVSSCRFLGWEGNALFFRFRSLCRLQFRRLMYEWKEAGGLLLALLSGERGYTEECVAEGFRKAGLAHILALSGMHLSLCSSLALTLGKKTVGERLGRFLQLFAVLFFVWFAGISPSLFRALLCSLIITISTLTRKKSPDLLTVLAASFLIHVMMYPTHIQSVAFKLSYVSLFGILALGKIWNFLYNRFLFPRAASSFSTSTSAQLITAPVNIRLFGSLSPVGVVASVLVSPLVTVFLYLGLGGIILCLGIPFLSPFIRDIMLLVYKVIKGGVLFFARCPSVTF